ncbi:MAG TPA: hypothetical protein VL485_00995 [Ktedonobacteraceae bacterium]|jgi:hypothetical protein|nr:hypothetical protein [Ktedonobacteraceae bacterium]
MARLNITLPDVLYARLEQLRDRINLSKVCAIALEKEVMMLEGQPTITDPRIAQLLQRLQSTRERWHQRGYEDGVEWAVELATRDELQGVATHLAEQDGRQLAEFLQMRSKLTLATRFAPPPPPPPMHHVQPPMQRAVFHASPSSVKAMPPIPPGTENVFYHHVGMPFPGFPESFHPAERLQYWQDQDREKSAGGQGGGATRIEVDESAYLEGWRDAVKGIWQTIAPALS